MIMAVITCVMRMISTGHQRIVIMTMAMTMPVVTFCGIFVVQSSEGRCPVGLRQPPGRDQRAQQH